MTKSSLRVFGFLAATALAGLAAPAARAQSIPSDAYNYCPVTNFSTWFASGTPTQNGVVVPANSANFDTSTNCNFYRWAEQMFLWITSPAPALYGGNGYVFESNAFYQVVSGPGNSLKFVSVAQAGPGPLKVNLRSAQVDSRGFQIIFDDHNLSHEIQPTPLAKSGTPLLRNSAGKLVPVGKVTVANGKASFSDTAGKPIAPQMKFTAIATPNNGAPVQEFNVAGSDVFVDPDGNVIQTDQGQAGGGAVLVGQNGGLVYYTTFVNDVFACYLTQTKNANGGKTPAGTQFPVNAQQVAPVVQYAAQHGKAITDPQALTMEFKLSWVEISPSQASNYVSIQALVPVYQPKTASQWTLTSQTRLVTLGLVGVHVVGSVTNHPEMLWATFERFGNTPNAAYSYINTASATVNVPQDGNGSWLFCQNTNCAAPFNSETGLVYTGTATPTTKPGDIVQPTNPTGPIGPSNTILWHPWGSASNTPPNPFVASAAESNSDVISTNNSVLSQLIGNDIRKNYVFVGNVWTNGGVQPTTPYLSPPGSGNEVGTSQLSNSTMETYQQGVDSNVWGVDGSCFQCHNKTTATPPTTPTVEISHIWPSLLPLFPPNGGVTAAKKTAMKTKPKK